MKGKMEGEDFVFRDDAGIERVRARMGKNTEGKDLASLDINYNDGKPCAKLVIPGDKIEMNLYEKYYGEEENRRGNLLAGMRVDEAGKNLVYLYDKKENSCAQLNMNEWGITLREGDKVIWSAP